MASKNQEDIKLLIPRPITPVIKPPMHRSIHIENIKREFKSNRFCHRTMGLAEVPINPPTQFLKKHSGKVPFFAKTQTEQNAKTPARQSCRDAVGKSYSLPKTISPLEMKTPKNFVRMNIIDAVRKVPPLPNHRVQVTRNGHVIVLEPSYVSKKSFGKTPRYISERNEEKEKQRRMEDERIKAIKPPLRLLPAEERNEMLTGLKTNWAVLNKEFLLLPMITDTIPKIRKKTLLEKQLNDLEKDIDLLDRNQSLYVCQNT